MTDDPKPRAAALRSPNDARRTPERTTLPHRIASRDLFADRKEIEIVHDGRHYRLRITQNGKLILTA